MNSMDSRKVGADLAHAWVRGRGVRVAVIDTGADTEHPDLRGPHRSNDELR